MDWKRHRRHQDTIAHPNGNKIPAASPSPSSAKIPPIPGSWVFLQTHKQEDLTSLTAASPHPPWLSHKTDPRYPACSLKTELCSCGSTSSDSIPDGWKARTPQKTPRSSPSHTSGAASSFGSQEMSTSGSSLFHQTRIKLADMLQIPRADGRGQHRPQMARRSDEVAAAQPARVRPAIPSSTTPAPGSAEAGLTATPATTTARRPRGGSPALLAASRRRTPHRSRYSAHTARASSSPSMRAPGGPARRAEALPSALRAAPRL